MLKLCAIEPAAATVGQRPKPCRLIARRIAVDRAAHVDRKRRWGVAAQKPAQPVRIADAIERVRGQQMLDCSSIA